MGEAPEEQDVLILIRALFIVSLIGLNEEERNWPGWQSRLIRLFLSALRCTEWPQKLKDKP